MCPQMYFNSTLTDSSKLLKPLLVFSFIICAIICGLTRIIQYKNHAIDVYLGFLLGGAIAVYLVGASPAKSLLWFPCTEDLSEEWSRVHHKQSLNLCCLPTWLIQSFQPKMYICSYIDLELLKI